MDKIDLLKSIKVRKATFQDYEAILDINRNVFQGFDYLPSWFYEMMHNPCSIAWVQEIKGKVVSPPHGSIICKIIVCRQLRSKLCIVPSL